MTVYLLTGRLLQSPWGGSMWATCAAAITTGSRQHQRKERNERTTKSTRSTTPA